MTASHHKWSPSGLYLYKPAYKPSTLPAPNNCSSHLKLYQRTLTCIDQLIVLKQSAAGFPGNSLDAAHFMIAQNIVLLPNKTTFCDARLCGAALGQCFIATPPPVKSGSSNTGRTQLFKKKARDRDKNIELWVRIMGIKQEELETIMSRRQLKVCTWHFSSSCVRTQVLRRKAIGDHVLNNIIKLMFKAHWLTNPRENSSKSGWRRWL